MRRLADRKFVFDWDTGEDTSTDFNPMCVAMLCVLVVMSTFSLATRIDTKLSSLDEDN